VIDATGLETHHVSAYYADRRGARRGRRRWPKLTLVSDIASHFILSAVVTAGPSQDSPQFGPAMRQAAALLPLGCVLGDAGYDGEHNHRLCREVLGVAHTVLALNRRNMGRRWPQAGYRRQMKRAWPRRLYGQRWQIESTVSRFKRRLSAALTARQPTTQTQEILLRVLTHNLLLLWSAPRGFQQSKCLSKPLASFVPEVSFGHETFSL
jgi:hypothetical protein